MYSKSKSGPQPSFTQQLSNSEADNRYVLELFIFLGVVSTRVWCRFVCSFYSTRLQNSLMNNCYNIIEFIIFTAIQQSGIIFRLPPPPPPKTLEWRPHK